MSRCSVSGGFCLLVAWFALANGWRLLAIVLGASLLHELGHYLLLRLLRAPILGFHVGIFGAVLETDNRSLSYGGELAAVLAGPGANLLAALLLLGWDAERGALFAGANLLLCGFNLLPLRPLDGGRALYLLGCWLLGPEAGERICFWAGLLSGLLLSGAILALMFLSGGSLWLLPALFGLLAALFQECRQKQIFF